MRVMRKYSVEEKERAVRMVRTLREELGTTTGTVKRVATQLDIGYESLRTCVRQADERVPLSGPVAMRVGVG